MANQLLDFFKHFINQPLPETAPPFTRWLNGILTKVEENSIEMKFVVRNEMTNPLGLLHGGVQAAILDDIIGMTVTTLDKDTPAVSVNLTVDFLGKAREGDTVYAISKVIRQGRQIINMVGELRDENSTLIAKATSNMLNVQIKK